MIDDNLESVPVVSLNTSYYIQMFMNTFVL